MLGFGDAVGQAALREACSTDGQADRCVAGAVVGRCFLGRASALGIRGRYIPVWGSDRRHRPVVVDVEVWRGEPSQVHWADRERRTLDCRAGGPTPGGPALKGPSKPQK